MAMFRCARFPHGTAKIRTSLGLVEFHDGAAEVDDEALAEALTKVPEVFGITEMGKPSKTETPRRPAKNATIETWRDYVLATVAISEEQARGMTRDQLIQLAP